MDLMVLGFTAEASAILSVLINSVKVENADSLRVAESNVALFLVWMELDITMSSSLQLAPLVRLQQQSNPRPMNPLLLKSFPNSFVAAIIPTISIGTDGEP